MKQSNVVKKSVSFPPELVERVKKYSQERKRSFSAQVSLWVEEKLREAEMSQDLGHPTDSYRS